VQTLGSPSWYENGGQRNMATIVLKSSKWPKASARYYKMAMKHKLAHLIQNGGNENQLIISKMAVKKIS